MNFKDKILVQCIVCLMIFSAVQGSEIIKQEDFLKVRKEISRQVKIHNTIDDIKADSIKILDTILGAPSVLASAVIDANSLNEFSEPIDKKTSEPIQPVYATGGGVVIYAGIDKKLGSCIKIIHQNKISIYGNLHTIAVVPDERVAKGQIIGTYDNNCNQEFYYHLADSMV